MRRLLTVTMFLVGSIFAGLPAKAQQLTTLYNFCSQGGADCTDGSAPSAYLIQGSDGNFYGTTAGGGQHGQGTFFKVTPSGTLTTLYSFCAQGGADCTDGAQPDSGVIEGSDGNFYGTTAAGGIAETYDSCGPSSPFTCGTVFKITPSGELTTLHSFCSQFSNNSCTDGANPNGLALGTDGNFYGTAPGGNAGGTIFKISPTGAFTTVYSFCEQQEGCTYGPGGLVLGSDGNFYGETRAGFGESVINGSVFKITPSGVLTILQYFCNVSGCLGGGSPSARLVEGSDGNFYGTTTPGYPNGSVFRVAPTGGGTTLYDFCSLAECADGTVPYGGLIQGSDGNFYGTTYVGGGGSESECLPGWDGCGTIFKITPDGTLTTLHVFCSDGTWPTCTDGQLPIAGLAQGTDFNFYGIASGGVHANGDGSGGIFFVLAALPVAGVSPSSLTFASQNEGTTSLSQPVTLSNTGQEALAVSSIVTSGDFAQTNNCEGSVAIGSNCTINVTFSPTQTGTRTGTLTITDNTGGVTGSVQTVTLTGTGANPLASLSPTAVDFGDHAIDTTSAVRKVTLTSSGTSSLTITSITITGANATDFSETNNCSGTLNAGHKCSISVTFTPTLLAAESATLQVSDNATNSPQTVSLTGTGEEQATLTPASYAFAKTKVGHTRAAHKFTLKNDLSTTLTGISYSTAAPFAVSTTTCGTTLDSKKTCTISVTFSPTVTGTATGTLTVSDSANDSPQTSSLTGTGD